MRLKLQLLAATLAVGTLDACIANQVDHVDERAVTGEYLFHSEEPDLRHASDRLLIKSDGHYVLTQGRTAQTSSRQEGLWYIKPGQPPNLVLKGIIAFPVHVRGTEIRLTVDDDLGQWYTKAK